MVSFYRREVTKLPNSTKFWARKLLGAVTCHMVYSQGIMNCFSCSTEQQKGHIFHLKRLLLLFVICPFLKRLFAHFSCVCVCVCVCVFLRLIGLIGMIESSHLDLLSSSSIMSPVFTESSNTPTHLYSTPDLSYLQCQCWYCSGSREALL